MSNLIIDQIPQESNYKVTLPCKPEEFTDFISSLLSKGLTIEKNYNDIFELTTSSIQQLYHLVTQRAGQNGGKLVSFNSKLYYSDKSSISFNSPEEFFGHNEIKKIETKALTMEMVYLIHFPERPSPEKQIVSIQFKPGRVALYRRDQIYSDESEITLQVHHSEKTWANDVVNLFNDFFSHHTYKPNKTTILWNILNTYISGASGFVCFGVGLLGIIFSYHFISANMEEFAKQSLANQSESIKYLVLHSYDSTMVNFSVASVFYIGVLIFISAFTAERLERRYRIAIQSQIIFTDEDRRVASLKEKKSKSQLFELSIELLKGVAIGIISNAIFTIIWY